MSSIARELDATTLTDVVRESMQQAHGASKTLTPANPQSWENRLASRSTQLATGRQGAAMQQVMDDLRD